MKAAKPVGDPRQRRLTSTNTSAPVPPDEPQAEKSNPDSMQNPPPPDDFLIVGIGASAGGIAALKTFFEHVPAHSGCAYVVILHLSPDFESKLAEILQRTAAIPVEQVRDEKVRVEPNRVYVIPPNRHLQMVDGHLQCLPVTSYEERRAPVDIFFRTLAESHDGRAVAVILSGTGPNGSMGVKRVKEKGGIILVQDPQEAEYGDMPRASIETELVDFVLPVAEIPEHIGAYKRHVGTLPVPETDEEIRTRAELDEAAMRTIFTQLRTKTGHDFSSYKRATILRRISRRMAVRESRDIQDYAELMKRIPDEATILLKDLLISVTNFFRDKAAFRTLEREVVPRILEGKGGDDTVRIWVAGCATGEEAYSLAMLFDEKIATMPAPPAFQIFASDIDDEAIAAARAGLYSNSDVADVSPERLRRHFSKEGDLFRIRRELRETILFTRHNVLRDPPFSHLHLATCRNLLIYLARTAQARVLQTAHFALEPGGYLFLGSSESVDGTGDLYVPLHREHGIYQSRAVQPKLPPPALIVPAPYRNARANGRPEREDAPTEKVPTGLSPAPFTASGATMEKLSLTALHLQLLEHYAPPSVLVNSDHDIVHLSERAGTYLRIAGGEPSYNLLKAVAEELRAELRAALFTAAQGDDAVRTGAVRLAGDEAPHAVVMTVRPVTAPGNAARGFFLVIFEREEALESAPTVLSSGGPEAVTRRLEEEISTLRARIRSTTEQYEVQTEELRASNEELQAINEELRSAAEELETGKEEIQSVNEELLTVNQELKVKVEELAQGANDIQNLMAATDIGAVFLDRALHVTFFTPAAREIFNLRAADLGRPLSDITHHLRETDLTEAAEAVMERLHTEEREVHTAKGDTFLMRILPYRTTDDRINGVVVTFVNITRRDTAERALREAHAHIEQQARIFDTTLSSISDFAYTFDRDGRFIYANRPLTDLLGMSAEEIVGKNFHELPYPDDLATQLQAQIARVIETGDVVRDETPFINPEGRPGYYEYIFTPVRGADGRVERVAGSTRDVTERKAVEEALRKSEDRTRTLSDAVPQIIWTNEPGGTANYFNRRWYEYSGLTVEESIGLGWQAIVHPDDEPASVDRWQRALDAEEVFETEYRLRRHDGAYRWFIGRNVPLKDERGKVTGWFGTATDIHRLKEVEEDLGQSRERLRVTMESATDYAIITQDVEGRIEAWSKGAERIFGWTEEEVLGKVGDFIFTPEDRAGGAPERERQKARDEGRAEDERWHMRCDGSRFYMSGVMAPIHDGVLTGYVKVARDMTEQRAAAEALREMSERLQLAAATTGFGIHDVDLRTGTDYWSAELKAMHGLRADAELSFEQARSFIHPDDRERVRTAMAAATDPAGTGEFEEEFRALRQDNGKTLWLYNRSRTQFEEDAAGQRVAVRNTGIVVNVTARRKAERRAKEAGERLRIAVDAAGLATWDWDLRINKTFWNEKHFTLFGMEPRPEQPMTPDDFFSHIHPDDAAQVQERLETAVREKTIFKAEFRAVRDDSDSVLWMHGYGMTVETDDAGAALRLSGVMEDITARKEAEQRKEEFLGVASHELKTPVTSIKAYAEMLHEMLEERGDAEATAMAAKLDAQVDRISDLIRDLLDATRVHEGRLQLAKERVDITALVQEAVEEAQRTTSAHRIELDSGFPAPPVEGDRARIAQVLTNLLGNAVKYSPAGGRVVVGAKVEEDKLVICVQDSGVGIPEEAQGRVFERFYRVSDPAASTYPGLGLGLYISAEIVKLHGGTMWVESRRGGGSTFFFSLPMTPGPKG